MKPFVHEIEQKQDSTCNYNSYRVEWSKTLFIQGSPFNSKAGLHRGPEVSCSCKYSSAS